ncbi:MAG: hypothetical protein ACRCUS_05530 [Anaerovoracaceae bacterium]
MEKCQCSLCNSLYHVNVFKGGFVCETCLNKFITEDDDFTD